MLNKKGKCLYDPPGDEISCADRKMARISWRLGEERVLLLFCSVPFQLLLRGVHVFAACDTSSASFASAKCYGRPWHKPLC
jgi:hypothetical protein